MTRKSTLYFLILFVLTALASTYNYLELPLRTIANTAYNLYPLFILRITFPFLWGLLLFLLVFLQKAEEARHKNARKMIETFFAAANILSLTVNVLMYLSVPAYNLILIAMLLPGIIASVIEVSVKKSIHP